MGFRQEMRQKLQSIESKLDTLVKAVANLKDTPPEVKRLEEQNKDLLDRIMSNNWTSYVNQSPDRWVSPDKEKQPALADEESLIGEEVDDYAGSNK